MASRFVRTLASRRTSSSSSGSTVIESLIMVRLLCTMNIHHNEERLPCGSRKLVPIEFLDLFFWYRHLGLVSRLLLEQWLPTIPPTHASERVSDDVSCDPCPTGLCRVH